MSHSRSRSPRSPREKSPVPQKRTSLLVRNIDQQVKPDELREFFSKFGDVRDVYIPRDYYTQKSRGFCFVEFLKYDDAREALEKTDGNEVLGKTVKIVFAREGRKAPHEMRKRDRPRHRRSSSPRRRHYRRSYSRTPPRYRRRDSHSSSR
ncbi:hypothetical protein SteCoe_21851 [Stentor coeruleus]|uniref:RRM domain-containing protein n=1 Tax=Stentor coeruleus TaxID=5963 RepID=A0A1R2BNK8_9CILI|nr:hypothetical protein SteCoe_21851 [Stentor coeruleus]